MRNKRGAIELSMSTIIVVIIGVVLLILGLTFVRGIFGNIDDLTKNAFDEGKEAIKKLGTITEELTVTSSDISMDKKGHRGIGVVAYNKDTIPHKYYIEISPGSETLSNSKLQCYVGETETSKSDTFEVKSGEQTPFTLIIKDGGSNLDLYTCNVKLYKDNALVGSKSVIVSIE